MITVVLCSSFAYSWSFFLTVGAVRPTASKEDPTVKKTDPPNADSHALGGGKKRTEDRLGCFTLGVCKMYRQSAKQVLALSVSSFMIDVGSVELT